MATVKTNLTSGTGAATVDTLEGIATIKRTSSIWVSKIGSYEVQLLNFHRGTTMEQKPGGVIITNTDGEKFLLNQRHTSIAAILKHCC